MRQWRRIVSEIEGPDCQVQLNCTGPGFAIWIWVKENLERLGRGAAGGPELLAEVGVARRKAWPDSVPELFGVGATGCKLLPEEAGLSFPD